MCFRKDYRYLTSRSYAYLSGHRFYYIKPFKNNDSLIVIDIVHNQGDIRFVLFENADHKVEELENPQSGNYIFKMEKDKKYRLDVISKKAYGKYKIVVMKDVSK